MQEIIRYVQVHMPLRLLLMKEHLPLVIKERINPEISFDYSMLETLQKPHVLEVAKQLADAELTVTFHAPFMDLRPGAIDPKIRYVSRERLQQVFDFVPYFHPLTVVCHPSFDARYYVSNRQEWLENSVETWNHFLRLAEDLETVIALENVYETEPELLGQLFAAFTSSRIRFCFDTGHFNVFARTPLARWMEILSPYLGQLHIHDNSGQGDDHLPVGEGTFPFASLFTMLRERNLCPIVTIEAHSEGDLWKALRKIQMMDLLAGMGKNGNSCF